MADARGRGSEVVFNHFNGENSSFAGMQYDTDNNKTRQATRYGIRLFTDYCAQQGVDTIHSLAPGEIARLLKGFYGQARTKDGQRFSVNSMIAIRYAINRYFRLPSVYRQIDIVKDPVFHEANETFRAVLKELERESRGTVCQRELQMVDTDDRRKLRHYFEHAISTPRGLLQKVWYDLMLRMGCRGREGQRMLSKESFGIATTAEGKQYIYQKDDGEVGIIAENPGDPLCPVRTFRLYVSRLNPACDALFQRPKEHVSNQDLCWYVNSPVGKNMLATMMSTISKNARLSRVYTNVHIRATTYSSGDSNSCLPSTHNASSHNETQSTSSNRHDGKRPSENASWKNHPAVSQSSHFAMQVYGSAASSTHRTYQQPSSSKYTVTVNSRTECANSSPSHPDVFPVALSCVTPGGVVPLTKQSGPTISDSQDCSSCVEPIRNDTSDKSSSSSGIFIPSSALFTSSSSRSCKDDTLPVISRVVSLAASSLKQVDMQADNGEERLFTSPNLIVPDEIPPAAMSPTRCSDTPPHLSPQHRYLGSESPLTASSEVAQHSEKLVHDQGIMCCPHMTSSGTLCKPVQRSLGVQTDFPQYSVRMSDIKWQQAKPTLQTTENSAKSMKNNDDQDIKMEQDLECVGNIKFLESSACYKTDCSDNGDDSMLLYTRVQRGSTSEESGLDSDDCENGFYPELNGCDDVCESEICYSLRMSVEEDDDDESDNESASSVVENSNNTAGNSSIKRCRPTKCTTWEEIAQRSRLQTLWGVKVFRDWLHSNGSTPNFENMSPASLAILLECFYEHLVKPDGDDYSASTMHTIRASISRFLSLPPQNKPFSIIRSKEFRKANDAFFKRIRSLQNVSTRPSMTDDDFHKILSSSVLSHDNAVSLQRKVWFTLTLVLGRQSKEALYLLKKNNFEIKYDTNGRKYVQIIVASVQLDVPKLQVCVLESQSLLCPVEAVELYLSRLSPQSNVFFQVPKRADESSSDIWYMPQSLSEFCLGGMMREISVAAGLSRHYNNQSLQATAATCWSCLSPDGFTVKELQQLATLTRITVLE